MGTATQSVYETAEYRAFVRAIRAAPDDDLPRLVCADWLEERGEVERAELVSVQCRLVSLQAEGHGGDCPRLAVLRKNRGPGGQMMPTCDRCDDVVDLWTRERRIWDANKCRWWGEREFIHYLGSESEDADGQYPESPKTFCSRGFIDRVSGPLELLIGGECGRCGGTGRTSGELWSEWGCDQCHATGTIPGILRELVKREPVSAIAVVNREPRVFHDGATWFANFEQDVSDYPLTDTAMVSSNWLPWSVATMIGPSHYRQCFPRFVRHEWVFPTQEAANAALSDAILAHVTEEVTR